MVPWCRLCRNMRTHNLERNTDPPLDRHIRGALIPHSIPVNVEGVWACIPKMGTEAHERLFEFAEHRVQRHLSHVAR